MEKVRRLAPRANLKTGSRQGRNAKLRAPTPTLSSPSETVVPRRCSSPPQAAFPCSAGQASVKQ